LPARTQSNRFWKVLPGLCILKVMRVNSNRPNGVVMAVLGLSSGFMEQGGCRTSAFGPALHLKLALARVNYMAGWFSLNGGRFRVVAGWPAA